MDSVGLRHSNKSTIWLLEWLTNRYGRDKTVRDDWICFC